MGVTWRSKFFPAPLTSMTPPFIFPGYSDTRHCLVIIKNLESAGWGEEKVGGRYYSYFIFSFDGQSQRVGYD